ncbi:hypothetical protein V865_000233 [Kwoniella europaea PYCC6329]|uniref:Chromosome transmission fidelity protein 8 n=1 Tax=Kwoniella europaea PYCC6329 TaxID=1423913 RepID=A0AAX4K768_9TREE
MRIHLPLHASQFDPPASSPSSSSSSSPLIQLGGDLVLVELQGELSYEGDKSDGVIGVIGLDRPDKPTLHLGPHHLLHGKFVNLQKPYAVIRKVIGTSNSVEGTTKLEGNASNEESNEEDSSSEEEEEEEENLFGQDEPTTPLKLKSMDYSSSPVYAPLTPMDYSSDLEMDPSSPARSEWDQSEHDDQEDEDQERPNKRAKTKVNGGGKISTVERRKKEKQKKLESGEKDRTRSYQVIGIVKRKVVFALRPEPLVAPTILPE